MAARACVAGRRVVGAQILPGAPPRGGGVLPVAAGLDAASERFLRDGESRLGAASDKAGSVAITGRCSAKGCVCDYQ